MINGNKVNQNKLYKLDKYKNKLDKYKNKLDKLENTKTNLKNIKTKLKKGNKFEKRRKDILSYNTRCLIEKLQIL